MNRRRKDLRTLNSSTAIRVGAQISSVGIAAGTQTECSRPPQTAALSLTRTALNGCIHLVAPRKQRERPSAFGELTGLHN